MHRDGRGMFDEVRAVAVFALLTSLAACRGDAGRGQVEQELVSVTTWTTPTGASVSANPGLVRRGLGAAASWEVVTDMTWARYREWVREGRGAGYRETTPADDGRVSFVRSLPGDRWLVSAAVTAPGPPLKVRVSFVAQAQ
jgi:hypothetical protein